MFALQRESNEDSYWWLDGEAPKTPQKMWATDGGSRDPVKLFEEFLRRCPLEMLTSVPLYLAIIQRPKTEVWYNGLWSRANWIPAVTMPEAVTFIILFYQQTMSYHGLLILLYG